MLAESIQEQLVRHPHPGALHFPEPQCDHQASYQIHHLHFRRHCSHLDYPSHHSRQAYLQYHKSFRVHYAHHFQQYDGRFF